MTAGDQRPGSGDGERATGDAGHAEGSGKGPVTHLEGSAGSGTPRPVRLDP